MVVFLGQVSSLPPATSSMWYREAITLQKDTNVLGKVASVPPAEARQIKAMLM